MKINITTILLGVAIGLALAAISRVSYAKIGYNTVDSTYEQVYRDDAMRPVITDETTRAMRNERGDREGWSAIDGRR